METTHDPLDGMTQAKWDKLTSQQRVDLAEWHIHPALDDALHGRYRVIVTFKGGWKERGYIGKSTGWRPCYLLIANARSSGGDPINPKNVEKVEKIRRNGKLVRR